MMFADLRGEAVLITGGTKGIGLATGLAFARHGARCILTHKWGSADETEVRARFSDLGGPQPLIVQADVASSEDTDALLAAIKAEHTSVAAFISNVSVAYLVRNLDDYVRRSLFKSIEYSAWPMVDYPLRIKKAFGSYPKYVIGLSSDGPDTVYANYDFVAIAKAVLETMCRYLSYHLHDEGVRVNVIRSRLVRTESLRSTFGADLEEFVDRLNMNQNFVECEEVANAILALCSGLMNGVSGQVIMVDRGTSLADNLMRMYSERETLQIKHGGMDY